MDEQDPNKQGKVVDDYEAASRATAQDEYEEYTKKGKSYTASNHSGRKVLIGLVVLMLVAGAAFAAYWFLLRKDNKSNTNTTSSTKSAQQSKPNTENSMITSEVKHYASSQFGLELDQPADWTVSDTTGSGRLVARSPALVLKDASGKSFTGQILFTIRNKQQTLPEFDKGNAVAARESDKIAYAHPSQVQRGSTYLSFLHYASSTGSSTGIDGVYITGDVGYKKDQAIPKADFTPVDPVISVTFVKCSDSNCNGEGAPVSISASMWDDLNFSKPLKAMLQSLTIS